MSTKPAKPSSNAAPVLKNTAAAPIIYFDNVPVYGASAGDIQVELAARMLAPKADGDVAVDLACTAHLRCSPQATASLIDALSKAIDMVAKSEKSKLLDS